MTDYYNDHSAVSCSMLKVLQRSPYEYYQRFITGDMQQADSEAMQFGRYLHALLLEPETIRERFAVAPKCDRRTTQGKADYAAFQLSLGEREVVSADDVALAMAISYAVVNHEMAYSLLSSAGECEKEYRWHDRIDRKCKIDKISHDSRIITDVKSVQSAAPSAFSRAAANYGWHLQAAYYQRAMLQITGHVFRFIFVACSKVEPYEVACYELDEADLEHSHEVCERLIDEVIERRETNNWFASWQDGLNTIRLPKYTFSDYYEME